jgi:YHS domain-containing protein
MVKDEICGTYVPREEALTAFRDGVEHHFCSEECRRLFLQG